MTAKLPTGPPRITVEVYFTNREKEFIQLRYGKHKTLKEIAELWHSSLRVVTFHSSKVLQKLGLFEEPGYVQMIRATKLLIKFGFITTEDLSGEKNL
jgi:DNA-binding NarL/FixJ family response regulator